MESFNYFRQFTPEEKKVVEHDTQILRRLQSLDPSNGPTWSEQQTRLIRSNYGHSSFGQVTVQLRLDFEVGKQLINRARFSIWLELRDLGLTDIANTILEREP